MSSNEKILTNLSKEEMIFYQLLFDQEYSDFVTAHLAKEYFPSKSQQLVYSFINDYHNKYDKSPSPQELKVMLENHNCSDTIYDEAIQSINDVEEHKNKNNEVINTKWSIDLTEEWCKKRAFVNEIEKCIELVESDKDPTQEGAMEGMQDALAVTFDREIGHEYFEAADERFERYLDVEERIPFCLDTFNKISGGGSERGTLSCLLSNRTGGFKSGTMCHLAADNIRLGQNVLYITLEMSEQKVAKRVDANLLDTKLDDLKELPKTRFLKQLERVKNHYMGRLVSKQFPTSVAHAGHFRFLLKELRRKKNFVPDVVYFDYLNICASQNLPASARANPYLWVKSIAEELRALAVEFNFAGWTATQSNRGGTGSSDLEMTDVSESIGLPNILDLFLAIMRSEDMDDLGQIKFKQLKNRDNDEANFREFIMGVDMSRMKLWDLKDSNLNGAPTGNPLANTRTISKGVEGFKFD